MLKPEQIPHEVAKLLEDEYLDHGDIYKATAVALNTWPGVRIMVDIDTGDDAAIKLPLNTENPDAAV